jgi:hypothetical protein
MTFSLQIRDPSWSLTPGTEPSRRSRHPPSNFLALERAKLLLSAWPPGARPGPAVCGCLVGRSGATGCVRAQRHSDRSRGHSPTAVSARACLTKGWVEAAIAISESATRAACCRIRLRRLVIGLWLLYHMKAATSVRFVMPLESSTTTSRSRSVSSARKSAQTAWPTTSVSGP